MDFVMKKVTLHVAIVRSPCRVRTGHGKPGKSWNLSFQYPGLESHGILLFQFPGLEIKVMEVR